MKPPDNTEIYEGELATFWFEDGILCANAKSVPRTLENQKRNYEFVRRITLGNKACLLSDATNVSPQPKEVRAYMESEMANYFIAMAVISDSDLGKLVTDTFIGLQGRSIPIRFFNDRREALEWLKTFL